MCSCVDVGGDPDACPSYVVRRDDVQAPALNVTLWTVRKFVVSLRAPKETFYVSRTE